MAHGLEAVDWQAPWLTHLRARGEPIAAQVNAGTACAQALNQDLEQTRPRPLENLSMDLAEPAVQFVPQAALPEGRAYESHIFKTRSVPTRDGLHDFFNGLCWLHFPLTKHKLNALQATEIERHGVQRLRGPVRDALTIFDENAAFLSAPDPLWEALINRDWSGLFVTLRPLWAQANLLLFGHALLEKLVYPRKGITAHVYRVPIAMQSVASVDAWVAQDLHADKLKTKPFYPLPVLGVPQWWQPNEQPGFYHDQHVFRAAKPPLASQQ